LFLTCFLITSFIHNNLSFNRIFLSKNVVQQIGYQNIIASVKTIGPDEKIQIFKPCLKTTDHDQRRTLYIRFVELKEVCGQNMTLEKDVHGFNGRSKALCSLSETVFFLVHKGIDELVQYLVFYKIDVDEEGVLRELARMYARYFNAR